jgi:excisionase family DNA binding protein
METLAYSVADLAKALSVTEKHIRKQIKDGKIRSIRMGDRVLVSKQEVERILAGADDE